MVSVGAGASFKQLAVDRRAAARACSFLQHQHGRAFADDETIAPGVERPRGARRVVVAGAPGLPSN